VGAATEQAASGRCLGRAGRGTFASVEPLSRLEIRVGEKCFDLVPIETAVCHGPVLAVSVPRPLVRHPVRGLTIAGMMTRICSALGDQLIERRGRCLFGPTSTSCPTLDP
jgi:hypothetical protein